jgi:hypothetical protein
MDGYLYVCVANVCDGFDSRLDYLVHSELAFLGQGFKKENVLLDAMPSGHVAQRS